LSATGVVDCQRSGVRVDPGSTVATGCLAVLARMRATMAMLFLLGAASKGA